LVYSNKNNPSLALPTGGVEGWNTREGVLKEKSDRFSHKGTKK